MKRVVAIVAVVLVLVPLSAAAVVAGLLATEWGRARTLALVNRAVPTLRLTGLAGSLPFAPRLERIELVDRDGVWLVVENARVAVDSRSLWNLAPRIDVVAADRVAVLRAPVATDAAPGENRPLDLSILHGLPVATIERLDLPRIELAEPLAGVPVTLAATGRLATGGPGGRADVELDVTRLGAPVAAGLSLRASLDPTADTAQLTLRGSDPGGLVARLIGRPDAGAASVDLAGEGPLASWKGRLDASIVGLGAIGLDLVADLRDPVRLGTSGTVTPEKALIPAAVAQVVQSPIAVEAEASLPREGGWQLERLHLASGSLRLDAVAAAAAGALPTAEATLTAGDLAVETLTVAGLRLHVVATPDVAERWTLVADGSAERLGVEGVDLAAAGPWTLSAEALGGGTGPLELRRFAVGNGLAELSGTGGLVPTSGEARADLRLEIADLGRLRALGLPAAAPTGGAATLTATATRANDAAPLDVSARLSLAALAGLPADLLPLLGPSPVATVAAKVDPTGVAAIEAAKVDVAAGSITASGTIDPTARRLDLRWQGAVPDLAHLSDLARVDLGGSLTLDGTASGPLDAPTLAASATVPTLRVGERVFDAVALRIEDAVVAPAPAARLTAKASRGGVELALAARARLDGTNVRLEGIELRGPGTTLDGTARVDTARNDMGTLSAEADLRGVVADLARLAPWHEQDLRGRAEASVTATPDAAGQTVRLDVTTRGLSAGTARIGTATLRATVADALRAPRLDASLDARDVAAGEARIEQASVSARGPLGAVAIDADAVGDVSGPARVDLRGVLAVAPTAVELRADRLDARFRGIQAAQRAPATLRLAGGGWSIAGLDLALAQGRLVGGLSAMPGGPAKGELRLTDLPLGALTSVGAPPLRGTLEGRLTASGAAASPDLALTLAARGIVYDGPAGEGVPPADLTVDATVEGRRLTADAQVSGISDEPVTASARLPVRVGLAPFAFVVDEAGAVSGRVVVDADLERITPRHLLDERRVAGRVRGELSMAGTLAEPRLEGSLDVAGGRYDDAVTGTTLRDLDIRLTGRGQDLVLERLTATDGAKGTLDGSGRARLGTGGALSWTATVTAKSLHALRSDLAEATVSGRIDGSGSLSAADVRGKLTIDDAEVRVPERLGGSIPVIDVDDGIEPAAPAVAEPTPAERSTLDLTVEAARGIFVRGRGLDSEWKAQLRIRGSIAKPRIEGPVTLVRGEYSVIGKRFELGRGIIRFQGSSPPDPALDLLATARAEGITAIVAITGRTSSPQLALSSDPALPQDEVLARLLFGRDARSISPAQALQIATALRELAGGNVGLVDVMGQVRDRIGLDTLDLGTESGESGVRAGKYLSDQVYLQVERGIEPGSGRATVEIELTPNVRVQSEVTDRAATGVGLEWRFDY